MGGVGRKTHGPKRKCSPSVLSITMQPVLVNIEEYHIMENVALDTQLFDRF